MEKVSKLVKAITSKYGAKIDLNKNPEILMDIMTELRILDVKDKIPELEVNPNPFEIKWMDSWAANWFLNKEISNPRPAQQNAFGTALEQLTDLKFKQRLAEIKEFVIEYGGSLADPPDAGPPEPGVPPAGPSPSIFNSDPPDAGPPEPGTPTPGPSTTVPDGGPPEPGVPGGPGPNSTILQENPWILYWFVSLKAPFIIDMIDAHFTRRINDVRQNL